MGNGFGWIVKNVNTRRKGSGWLNIRWGVGRSVSGNRMVERRERERRRKAKPIQGCWVGAQCNEGEFLGFQNKQRL